MRNLLTRLVLWAVRRLSIDVIPAERLLGGTDAVERGARWEAFYREEGGLADMLAAIRREAFEAAAELDPKDTDKIYYWAMADRNVRKLEQRIQQVVIAGKTEAERRLQIERMNAARIVR